MLTPEEIQAILTADDLMINTYENGFTDNPFNVRFEYQGKR